MRRARARIGPATEVTIIPASPARHTLLALWTRDDVDAEFEVDVDESAGDAEHAEHVDLVVPVGGRSDVIDRVRVPCQRVSVSEVLDELVAIGPGTRATASAHAWGTIARAALGLIAAGRLQQAITTDGHDQWIVGPFSEPERATRAAFVDALPPTAHCVAHGSAQPAQLLAAERAVVAFYHAVADSMPRTAAAPIVAGQREWASADVSDLSRLRSQLPSSDSAERTMVGVRLRLPTSDDGPFVAELQVRSAVDPSLVADADALWRREAEWLDAAAETGVLRAIRRGAAWWAPLRRLLDDAQPTRVVVSDDEAMELLGDLAIDLGGLGIEVLVPAALTRSLTTTAHVESPPGADDGPALFDLDTVCRLRWRATVDGEPVSDAELDQLAAGRRPLVKLRGEWVVVDPRMIARLERRDELSGADALAAALSGRLMVDDEWVAVETTGGIVDVVERLLAASSSDDAALGAFAEPFTESFTDPIDLHAELRPYQRRGVIWIESLATLGFGGVLADDMGLGKTIQVIAALLRRLEHADGEAHALAGENTAGEPTLVVCPASVVTNWARELERFAPSIAVRAYVGADRTLAELRRGEVVVTTYGLARRDVEVLGAVRWGVVVADEAQHIKNPNSSTARAMRRMPARLRLALTGTPIENRLTELWALIDWTTPGLLGSVEEFRRRISIPIERDGDDEVKERFGRMVAPFLLRRRKSDPLIAPELPPKTETTHTVLLTAEQAGLYRAAADEILSEIGRAEGIARRGQVLRLLTALKQVCNHPAHFLRQPGPLGGRSGKLDAFEELVVAITEAEDAVLVFTQYVAMGELLLTQLAELGIGAEFLHGGVALHRRTEMVDRFQAGDFPVFVISVKAGGTGLNLTRATHVIHYDRWWNPAVENQASDRAWRIGQDRPVQVHHLISEGSLEERIAEVLASKQALADDVLGGGESWISDLGDDELSELVALGGSSR